eukprot:GHRQ01014463.1.p2 GENE.GHRQ01014463.1~~GHRQ01014463.1.p2  ORF type:complete len:101 (+),score=14.81 GHRQ01014463.1:379-681(+)
MWSATVETLQVVGPTWNRPMCGTYRLHAGISSPRLVDVAVQVSTAVPAASTLAAVTTEVSAVSGVTQQLPAQMGQLADAGSSACVCSDQHSCTVSDLQLP